MTDSEPNNELATITLFKGGEPYAMALIDAEDAERVGPFTWCLAGNGYVHAHVPGTGRKNRRFIYIHRLILNAPDGSNVDHRDGNRLDNRKANLRLATVGENGRNRPAPRSSSSGYKGVSWRANGNRWEAYIQHEGKQRSIGRFANVEDAARAYDDKARELFGEFAWLNFPSDTEIGHSNGALTRAKEAYAARKRREMGAMR
jgi:hypothetical protein